MRVRRYQSRLYITLLTILVLCVLIVSLYVREGDNGPLHRTQARLRDLFVTPVSFIKKGYVGVSDWFSGIFMAGELKRENEELRRQISESRRLVLEAQDLKRENEELRKAFGLKERFPYRLIPAQVVIIHQEIGGKFYTVDRGQRDGIERNDPVISSDGLFGRVYQVGKSSAVIIPLNHPMSSVSVRVVETKEVGVVEGTREEKLMLRLIPKESKASIGSIVVTSGLGKIFPEGLLVGTILNVKEDPNRLDKVIEVGPAVNYAGNQFFYILKNEGETR